MPTTLSAIQKKILEFIVEIYDKEIHGPLNLETIVSGTGILEHIVRNNLLEMKQKDLLNVSPAKIYSATQNGVAKITGD